jgi:hypothetical protein
LKLKALVRRKNTVIKESDGQFHASFQKMVVTSYHRLAMCVVGDTIRISILIINLLRAVSLQKKPRSRVGSLNCVKIQIDSSLEFVR